MGDVIRQQALRFLARREYSRYELQRRLLAKGWNSAEVDFALDELSAEGLQKDARFVESYIRHRREAGYGPRRILAELAERGIYQVPADLADENSIEWLDVLKRACEKKFGIAKAQDVKSHAKRIRFLLYRGFAPEQIRGFVCKK